MHNLIYICIGLLSGVCSGLFGIGGGIVIVPLLAMWVGMSQHAATGTSLLTLLLPVGILGAWKYYDAGRITADNMYIALWIALGLVFGAFFGAKISVNLDEQILRRVFSAFLVLVAAKLWHSTL